MNQKNNIYTFGFKKAKQSMIIGIALLISFLINLPRALSLYDIVDRVFEASDSSSVIDLIIRFIVLTIFSWLVLQFNTNWNHIFVGLSKPLKAVLTVVVNVFLYFTCSTDCNLPLCFTSLFASSLKHKNVTKTEVQFLNNTPMVLATCWRAVTFQFQSRCFT